MLDFWLLLLLATCGPAALAVQPDAPSPIAAPLRDLNWGQLNFLHTTDVHGWFGGHLQEPSFSADWGDYISFSDHMHRKADAEGVDLVLVDTGDRVEGNGLYDGSEPKGKYTHDILKEQSIDLICSGNHELYLSNTSYNEFEYTVPDFKGNYIASNLDIINKETGKQQPLAQRFKKFTTKNQHIRVLAFGFIYDFTGNANNTVVQPVEETVEENWFQEAIRDREVDVIVIFGHVPVRSKEFNLIYKTIRSVQWDTPISFFGGHYHIRDYKTYDRKSAGIASGRYLETIGFLSISGLSTAKSGPRVAANPQFSRRYIDNNLFSMYHHSSTNSSTFPTSHGRNVSAAITDVRSKLKLSSRRGCAPQDLWVNRRPYPHNESIFSWLESSVLPDEFSTDRRVQSKGKKALVLVNTGAMRFDIFKGPFTRDTEFLVSPFTSPFRGLRDVPFAAARRVIQLLNSEGPILQSMEATHGMEARKLAPPEQWGRGDSATAEEAAPHTVLRAQNQAVLNPANTEGLTPGYTTTDDAGNDGDDTIHEPVSFYKVPNCIQATVGFELTSHEAPEKVDLIYNAFVEDWVILALKYLGEDYSKSDARDYLGGRSMTDIITDWVQRHWDVKGEDCP